jgi:hypothetical protein
VQTPLIGGSIHRNLYQTSVLFGYFGGKEGFAYTPSLKMLLIKTIKLINNNNNDNNNNNKPSIAGCQVERQNAS